MCQVCIVSVDTTLDLCIYILCFEGYKSGADMHSHTGACKTAVTVTTIYRVVLSNLAGKSNWLSDAGRCFKDTAGLGNKQRKDFHSKRTLSTLLKDGTAGTS